MTLLIVASLTDDSRGIINDHNMLVVQALLNWRGVWDNQQTSYADGYTFVAAYLFYSGTPNWLASLCMVDLLVSMLKNLFPLSLMARPNKLECLYLAITFQSNLTFAGSTRSLPEKEASERYSNLVGSGLALKF